jgi:motility quorum-sensing regulator / GCU-specific mRNA interferase toxin
VTSGGGPTYELALVQKYVADGRWIATHTAFAGAAALGLDRSDVVDCITDLCPTDFYKTMESDKPPKVMFDVYRPTYLGISIYLKIKITDVAVVVSFKKDESR